MNKANIPTVSQMPKMMPELSLDTGDLPEIKDWKVGKKYKIALEVEQISLNKDTMDSPSEDKGQMRARFRVIKAHDISGSAELTDKEVNPADEYKAKKVAAMGAKASQA